MSPADHARAPRSQFETPEIRPAVAKSPAILAFPRAKTDPSAMLSSGDFWARLETDANLQRRRRAFFWIGAIAVHLALAVLFVVSIAEPDQPVPDSVAIEMVAPPAPSPPQPVPPPQEVAKEAPKVKIATPRPIPRLRLQMDTPQPTPSPIAELPALPPEPAPSPPAQILPPQTYLSELYRHLARNKHYPRAAQLAHLQGTAILRFTTDRNGKVLSYKIERSAGSPILDQEVADMIERAQPLPALPSDMPDQLELTIPIQFSVK